MYGVRSCHTNVYSITILVSICQIVPHLLLAAHSPCRSVSQGVELPICLPKTAWPPTFVARRARSERGGKNSCKTDRSHVVPCAKELCCQFVFLRPLGLRLLAQARLTSEFRWESRIVAMSFCEPRSCVANLSS